MSGPPCYSVERMLFGSDIVRTLPPEDITDRWTYSNFGEAVAALRDFALAGYKGEPQGWRRHVPSYRRRDEFGEYYLHDEFPATERPEEFVWDRDRRRRIYGPYRHDLERREFVDRLMRETDLMRLSGKCPRCGTLGCPSCRGR